MSETPIPINVPFEEAKTEIWEGDLLLFRTRGGRLHRIAKTTLWDNDVFAVEVRRFQGVTIVPLEQAVLQYPDRIDVYEVNPQNRWENYDRQGAMRYLKHILFSKADQRGAVLETLLKLFLRLERKIGKTPYGAEAIRMADRLGGGVDPVPEVTDTRIDAAGLVLSPLYRYRFTLK